MNEWSTFMDGEDCRECLEYEKRIQKYGRDMATARTRIKELENGLGEVLKMAEDKESMQVLGLFMLGPISVKLRELMED